MWRLLLNLPVMKLNGSNINDRSSKGVKLSPWGQSFLWM